MFSSCRENNDLDNKHVSLDDFSKLSDSRYCIDAEAVRRNMEKLAQEDGVLLATDRQVKKYYSENNPFIWVNRLGVYSRADTLLRLLLDARIYGFGGRMLKIRQIEEDLSRIRNLDVDDGGENGVNKVLARLEYNLTKAFVRYFSGLRFGLLNPNYLYNNIEEYQVDSTTTRFRQLSDLRVERPNEDFFRQVIAKAFNDSIGDFFSTVRPKGGLHEALVDYLNKNELTREERLKAICNIERCRWRLKILSGKDSFDKYVEVNIPSFSLSAVDRGRSTLSMRVACGTTKYKTPLLTSWITRMDVNPQWIIPKSIAKGYVGDNEYMHRMGMFVLDKKKGKLPPEEASYEKVMNGEQYIIQAGGPKNSLGRIIFRFENNFSVFLHDTSSPWLFQRNRRAVSHGCVRVEKPYELALFLLDGKDEDFEEKLKYSMTVELVNDNDSLRKRHIDRKRMVNSKSVKPSVPLFITYYTIYFDVNGKLVDYQDVYGYDEVMAEKLAPFVD